MTKVLQIGGAGWSEAPAAEVLSAAQPGLEAGDVLFLPALAFAVEPAEALLFTPAILGSSKNTSYDPASGRLGGTTATGPDAETLRRFIHRFSESAASLVDRLLPAYRGQIARPRELSARRDRRTPRLGGRTTRLHVDGSSGDAVGRPPHSARLQQRESGGARARVADRRRLRSRRAAVRATLRVPLPGRGTSSLVRVIKTPRSPYDDA